MILSICSGGDKPICKQEIVECLLNEALVEVHRLIVLHGGFLGP